MPTRRAVTTKQINLRIARSISVGYVTRVIQGSLMYSVVLDTTELARWCSEFLVYQHCDLYLLAFSSIANIDSYIPDNWERKIKKFDEMT